MAKEIINYCRQNLVAYTMPRIVEFLDALPQTASGKRKKYVLKEKNDSSLSFGAKG